MAVQVGVFAVVAADPGLWCCCARPAWGAKRWPRSSSKVQLEAADILRTIRSGILTIDGRGFLLYANPAASELLGFDLRGTPDCRCFRC